MTKLSLTDANKNYDEMIERVSDGETFITTRYGKETAVVAPYEDFVKFFEDSSATPETLPKA